MKIAMYKAFGIETIWETTEYRERDDSPYIRTSNIVEVQFEPLPLEVTVPRELAQLEEMEKALIAKHLTELGTIQSRRKDLLSLAPPKAVEAA